MQYGHCICIPSETSILTGEDAVTKVTCEVRVKSAHLEGRYGHITFGIYWEQQIKKGYCQIH